MVTDTSVYDNASVLLPHFITETEVLTTALQGFYKKTGYNDDMLRTLEQAEEKFLLSGVDLHRSLSFARDLMETSIQNVSDNVPGLYISQHLK